MDFDWDDDDNEQWCADQRGIAQEYLGKQEGAKFGPIGETPAWYIPPYVAVWAVESAAAPGRTGWWVISGDLPTDYASSAGASDPRSAVAAFAQRWNIAAAAMESGEPVPNISVGDAGRAAELAPLLKSRAETLAQWARDDSMWEE